MSGSISFNPMLTTNAGNSFVVESSGLVQGMLYNDPSARNWIQQGFVASSVTQPIWGGMAIQGSIPVAGQSGGGNPFVLAATNAAITGFTVFDGGNNAIVTPGNSVPLISAGMSGMFVSLGSYSRVAVQIDPTLIDQDGNPVTTQFSWDFTNQKLIAYNSTIGALPVRQVMEIQVGNSKVVAYNSTTKAATWSDAGAAAIILI